MVLYNGLIYYSISIPYYIILYKLVEETSKKVHGAFILYGHILGVGRVDEYKQNSA